MFVSVGMCDEAVAALSKVVCGLVLSVLGFLHLHHQSLDCFCIIRQGK